MKLFKFRWVFLLCALAPATLAGARGELTEADKGEIRKVINAQLEAFQRDDGDKAFSYASPGIKRAFGSAENFMKVVKGNYLAVYRPRAIKFLELAVIKGAPIQVVQLLAPDGSVQVAFYTMQRQADKIWKIDGCELAPANALST
jgi:hypothetical protein